MQILVTVEKTKSSKQKYDSVKRSNKIDKSIAVIRKKSWIVNVKN